MAKDTLFYDFFEYDDKFYLAAATERGLAFVSSGENQFYEFSSFYPQKMLIKDSTKVKPFTDEIIEYLNQERRKFSIPFDILDFGTPFQKEVFRVVLNIPYGRTMTTGNVASALNATNHAREVRNALALNPILIVIPTHRVVLSKTNLGIYRGGPAMQQSLINLEREALISHTNEA